MLERSTPALAQTNPWCVSTMRTRSARTMRAVSSSTTWTMRASASSSAASCRACSDGDTSDRRADPALGLGDDFLGDHDDIAVVKRLPTARRSGRRGHRQGGSPGDPRPRVVRGSPGRLEPAPCGEVGGLVEVERQARILVDDEPATADSCFLGELRQRCLPEVECEVSRVVADTARSCPGGRPPEPRPRGFPGTSVTARRRRSAASSTSGRSELRSSAADAPRCATSARPRIAAGF